MASLTVRSIALVCLTTANASQLDDMSIILDHTVSDEALLRRSRTNYFNVFTVYDYMLELGKVLCLPLYHVTC